MRSKSDGSQLSLTYLKILKSDENYLNRQLISKEIRKTVTKSMKSVEHYNHINDTTKIIKDAS